MECGLFPAWRFQRRGWLQLFRQDRASRRPRAPTSRLTKPHRSTRKSMPHNKKPGQLGVSFTSASFVKTASKRRDGEDALKRSVLVSAATLVCRSAGWTCEHLLRESLVHERFSPVAKNCANSLDERQAAPVSDNTMVFWLFLSLVGLTSGLRAIGFCAREIERRSARISVCGLSLIGYGKSSRRSSSGRLRATAESTTMLSICIP